MGSSRTDAAGDATASNGTERSRRTGLRGLLRAAGAPDEAVASAQLAELEREVALLREENARLKVARAHASDRPLNERMRALFPAAPDGDGEDTWEALTECMLLREVLLDACRELEQGAGELRARLETLLGDAVGAASPDGDFEGVA
ncbi:MAG: hypothetical protein ACTHOE_09295 [Conexibacter sp.]